MNINQLLLTTPDEHLDPAAKNLIKDWEDPPKALEILKVLDNCTRYALASELAMVLLNGMLASAIQNENTTYNNLVKLATWRNYGL